MFGAWTRFDGMKSHIWSGGLVARIAHLDAAGPEYVVSMAKLHEGAERRLGDIGWIFRPQRLGKNVPNAHGFNYGSDCFAADQSSPWAGRLE